MSLIMLARRDVSSVRFTMSDLPMKNCNSCSDAADQAMSCGMRKRVRKCVVAVLEPDVVFEGSYTGGCEEDVDSMDEQKSTGQTMGPRGL